MINPEKLEKYFHQFTDDLSKWIQDGIQEIDENFVQRAGINIDGQSNLLEGSQQVSRQVLFNDLADKIVMHLQRKIDAKAFTFNEVSD